MRKPPDLEELEKACANRNYKYDFAKAEQVLAAMDFLRGEGGQNAHRGNRHDDRLRRTACCSQPITASFAMK